MSVKAIQISFAQTLNYSDGSFPTNISSSQVKLDGIGDNSIEENEFNSLLQSHTRETYSVRPSLTS